MEKAQKGLTVEKPSDSPTANIIFDEPASYDAFEGGGHQRSASALADSIIQLADRDGAIGLEGPWGSGKSTVIKLADIKLESIDHKHKYSTYTFDLWTHQSDEFRRAFLEGFVSWLEQKKFLNNLEVATEREKIRDKVKTIRSANTKEYSWFGIFLIFVLVPLLPIAYTWLSPFAFSPAKPGGEKIFLGMAVPQLAITTTALLLILVFLYNLKKNWKREKFRKALSITTAIFTRDVQQDTVRQNIRDEDPTTIEFYKIFRHILSKAQKSSRRIIFVLDNIDRLPTEMIPLAWSEMRSLFSHETPEARPSDSYVTVVVPYDKKYALSALHGEMEIKSKNSEHQIEGDVFSKTFDRILRISPPIATDWKKFLEDSLKASFGNQFNENDAYKLFKLLDLDNQQKSIHPTPRRIITFVNEIGALWTQWGDLIPVESIALYVLHRTKIESNPNALKAVDLISRRYEDVAGIKDWRRDFAALTFNVDPIHANQVLLEQDILNAIIDKSPDKLQRLAQLRGFEEVLTDVIANQLPGTTSTSFISLANSSSNIESLALGGELGKSVWRGLARALESLHDLSTEDMALNDGIYTILKNLDSEESTDVSKFLRSELQNSITFDEHNDSYFDEGKLWLDAIARISEIMKDKAGADQAINFLRTTEIPNDTSFCLGVADACAKYDEIEFDDLDCHTPQFEILNELSKLIPKEPTTFRRILTETSSLLENNARRDFLTKIAEQLRKPEIKNTDSNALLRSFDFIFDTTPTLKEAKDILTSLVIDGTLVWHAHLASRNEDHDTATIALWLRMRNYNPDTLEVAEPHPQLGTMTPAQDWYSTILIGENADTAVKKTLADKAAAHGQFTEWTKLAIQESPDKKLFKDILTIMSTASQINSLVVAEVAQRYPDIKTIIGNDNAKIFLKKYSNWSQFYEKTFGENKCHVVPTVLIEDIHSLGKNPDLLKIFQIIDEHLKNLPQSTWEDALLNETDDLRLLVARRKSDGITLPVSDFLPALRAHAKAVLTEESYPDEYSEDWSQVVGALKPASRKTLAKEIFNDLPSLNLTQEGVERFLELYPETANNLPLENSAKTALDSWIYKIVQFSSDEIRQYVEDHIAIIQACVKSAEKSSLDLLDDAISGLEEKSDKDANKWAIVLRDSFGLEKFENGDEEEV